MRVRRPTPYALKVVMLTFVLILFPWTLPAQAQQEPPFTCNQDNLGRTFVDEYGIVWSCEKRIIATLRGPIVIFGFEPVGGTQLHVQLVYDSNTYGMVVVVASQYNNPDIGVASVANYNPDGSHRYQVTGEMRIRTIIQYLTGGSWVNCQNTGFEYSTSSATQLINGFDMQIYADCGDHYYRTQAAGHVYVDGIGWKGGEVYTGQCWRTKPCTKS